jgi:Asp/Glu/hydantoin racemase
MFSGIQRELKLRIDVPLLDGIEAAVVAALSEIDSRETRRT